MRLCFQTAASLILCASALLAQDPRGTILGRVIDEAKAVIPGAQVQATNIATGVKAGAVTNASGAYTIPFLNPGVYTITAEMHGFKRFVRQNVQVRIGESVELNIPMELGQVSDTVQVTAAPPLLDTSSPSLGQVIDTRRVTELPLLAGNAFELALLTPGVVNGTNMRDRKPAFNNGDSQISTDGNGTYNNEFQIDGVSNTFADGSGHARVAFSPPQTSIQEFKMETATYDASIGHTIGSLVNVSTVSGTNQLHGEAHWFVRNRAFDAPNFFNNKAGTEPAVYQDNRYGASAGGPVYIPHLYDGRNKTFWFYAWEGNKWGVPSTYTGTMPTDAERLGDFSALLSAPKGSNYQIYDPATTTAVGGGRFSRQPFPGNVIPTSRLDPVGLALVKLYPEPNQPGTADGRNNFFNGVLVPNEDYYAHIAKVDHAFSENHRIFIRVDYDWWQEHKNDYFNNGIDALYLHRINRGLALDDVLVLSPSFLLNLRYGMTDQEFPEYRATKGYDLSSLGFSPALTGLIDKSLATVPRVTLGAFSTIAPWESGDGTNTSFTHTFVANFTKTHGTHNLRFGADFRVYRAFGDRYPRATSPDLAYSTTYTRGPFDNSTSAPVGQELASMLLGIPDGSMERSASYAMQGRYLGVYIQDDFKLASNFTLNLGLRYEKEWPITERYDRLVAGFDATAANPIAAQAQANYAQNPIPEISPSAFRVPGGLTFVNANGIGRSPFQPENTDFMPRVGFAWQVRPATVIRAGYGIFYDTLGVNKTEAIQTGFSQATPIQASLDNGLTFVANNENPEPNGLLAPLGADGGLATNLGQDLSFYLPTLRHAYVQRWSFGVQHQVKRFLIDASYVGNRGTRLGTTRDLNNVPASYLSTSPVRDQATINYLGTLVPNPFYGTNPIYGTSISRADLLRPYPEFGEISDTEPIGLSWYHAMQLRAERRMANGFTFQLGYTWSKAMEAIDFLNPTDPIPAKTIGSLDRPQRLAISGIYELPFGRGRTYGANLSRAVDALVGGWQLDAVITFQSGAALGFGNALFSGDIHDIALPSDQRNVDRWFNTDAGFNRNSSQQLADNIRTFPLRLAGVRGDSQNRWDFSAIKEFSITEKVKFQFRAECFNALNHAILNNPNTSPTSSSFGRITGTAAQSRTFQFAGKLRF